MLTTAKLNATGHCWVGELADFTFNIKYRPGHANGDGDALSRMPLDFINYMGECTENISLDHNKAAIDGVRAQYNGGTIWVSVLTYNENLIEADEEFLLDDQPAISNNTILQAQKQDHTIGRVLN